LTVPQHVPRPGNSLVCFKYGGAFDNPRLIICDDTCPCPSDCFSCFVRVCTRFPLCQQFGWQRRKSLDNRSNAFVRRNVRMGPIGQCRKEILRSMPLASLSGVPPKPLLEKSEGDLILSNAGEYNCVGSWPVRDPYGHRVSVGQLRRQEYSVNYERVEQFAL